MDENQEAAVEVYEDRTGRRFVPGQIVELPIDALVFTEHQKVWTTLEDYKKDRCKYDPETNEWLVYFVTDFLRETPRIPLIFVDILDDGVALVDGVHRVTSAFIAEQPTILAQLNAG